MPALMLTVDVNLLTDNIAHLIVPLCLFRPQSRVPMKWMAPESLAYNTYTTHTDVSVFFINPAIIGFSIVLHGPCNN